MKPILPLSHWGDKFTFPLLLLARLRHCLPSSPTSRPGLTTQVTQWRETPSILPRCISLAAAQNHLLKLLFKPSTRLISSPSLKRTGTHATVKPSQGYLHRPQYPELAVLYPDPRSGKDVPPPPMDCTPQTLHCGLSPSLGKCKQHLQAKR